MVIADVIFLAEVSFLTEVTIRPGKPSQKLVFVAEDVLEYRLKLILLGRGRSALVDHSVGAGHKSRHAGAGVDVDPSLVVAVAGFPAGLLGALSPV